MRWDNRMRMRWDDRAMLLVVKAVSQVESEIIIDKTKVRNRHSVRDNKWDKIVSLLPPDLGQRHQGKRKSYKCQRLFDALLHEYREMAQNGRKRGKCIFQNTLIFEMLKKREERLNGVTSSRPDTLRTMACDNIDTETQETVHLSQNTNKSDSSDEEHPSYGNAASAHGDSLEENRNNHEKSLRSNLIQRKSNMRWNERAQLLVVKAVLQVELDGYSTPNKWERVVNLLPPELRARSEGQVRYKCQALFQGLWREYLEMTRFNSKQKWKYKLSEKILEVLKKRDALWNGPTSHGSDTVSTRACSAEGLTTSNNTRDGIDTARQETVNSSQNAKESETSDEELPSCDNTSCDNTTSALGDDLEQNHNDHEKSLHSPSRSSEDSKNAEDVSKFPTRSRVCGDLRSSTSQPSGHREGRLDDDILDQPVRTLHLELSRLESWVDNKFTRVWRNIITKEDTFAKTPKLDVDIATELFQEVTRENLSREMDRRIEICFEKLRTQVAEEVHNISVGQRTRHVSQRPFHGDRVTRL